MILNHGTAPFCNTVSGFRGWFQLLVTILFGSQNWSHILNQFRVNLVLFIRLEFFQKIRSKYVLLCSCPVIRHFWTWSRPSDHHRLNEKEHTKCFGDSYSRDWRRFETLQFRDISRTKRVYCFLGFVINRHNSFESLITISLLDFSCALLLFSRVLFNLALFSFFVDRFLFNLYLFLHLCRICSFDFKNRNKITKFGLKLTHSFRCFCELIETSVEFPNLVVDITSLLV